MPISDGAHDPETLAVLTRALDRAWNKVPRTSDPVSDQAARTAMAVSLMAAANLGERDPERLKLVALRAANGRVVQ